MWINLAAKAPSDVKPAFETVASYWTAAAEGVPMSASPAHAAKASQAGKYLYNNCKIRPPSNAP